MSQGIRLHAFDRYTAVSGISQRIDTKSGREGSQSAPVGWHPCDPHRRLSSWLS
jgi:hypothetical protein